MFLEFVFLGKKPCGCWKIQVTGKSLWPWLIESLQENILRYYLETSDFEGLKSLFCHGLSVNTEICGNTLLWWAVEKQDSSLVLFFLENGAYLDSMNAQSPSILLKVFEKAKGIQDAASEGFKMVKMLLEKGAEVNVADRCGDSAAMIALNSMNMPLFCLLIEHGADVNRGGKVESLLAAAVRMQLPEAVRLLLAQGAEMTTDSDGRPLLHTAILMNNPEIVELLLEHGADVKERDDNGETPFLLNAGGYCNEAIATALLKFGADINERTSDGGGVLHIGLYSFEAEKDSQWFDFLLNHGADLEMEDNEGITPFAFAMQFEKLSLMDYLLSRGVDPDGINQKTMPPLMVTVLRNQPQSARLLLKYHADPTIRCGAESPLEYVSKRGSAEMKQVFEPFLGSNRAIPG